MQLEVVALLFSDVLLMTKFQKKGERLKVVRPPLALDRTCCVVLKDGCESGCRAPSGEGRSPSSFLLFLAGSFVLVEVGELQSVMNVYIFAASSAESCSTWVSTIQQAKVTIETGTTSHCSRQLLNTRILISVEWKGSLN